MKWFKHKVGSTSDPDMQESEALFKADGPYVFFRALEILAKEDVLHEPLSMNFVAFSRWFPSVSKNRLQKILTFWSEKNQNSGKIPRIFCEFIDKKIIIFCEELSDISSTYTKNVITDLKKKNENSDCRIKNKNKNKNKINTMQSPAKPELKKVAIWKTINGHDIDYKYRQKVINKCRNDIEQAGRAFYRVFKACERNKDIDPIKYMEAGFIRGYIWNSHIDETQNPGKVRKWVDEEFCKKGTQSIKDILGGII